MLRHVSVCLFLSTFIAAAGCTKQQNVAKPTTSPPVSQVAEVGTEPVVSLLPKEATAEEKHDAALLEALGYLAERKYAEALTSLELAKAAKDTDQVRELMARAQSLQLREAAFEQTVASLRAAIDQGQAEQAAQLTIQALAQYGDADEARKLSSVKRQADALLAATNSDVNLHITRYRSEAENALKDNNLRAALIALEQALALRPDPALQQKMNDVQGRLAKYDAARDRALELRKNPQSLEEALVAYQEAVQTWDTLQVREEMVDTQLALEKRRERLAVATFEVRGDAALADLGANVAEELLPHLRRRYDLVERGQINQILSELKVVNDDLLSSEQGLSDLSRITKARYLVVGSVSPLSGVTIHARLVDLRSGLIMQTSKIVAPTPEAALKKIAQLAAVLQMSDEDKLAYERQLAHEPGPAVVSASSTFPSLPPANVGPLPAAMTVTTNRPPAFGTLQPDDFDRLPPLAAYGGPAVPPMEPVVFLEQERPLRTRLLTLQIELGDNLLRRGRHQDAFLRFQLARELDPANIDILTRINLCQPHLPPGLPHPRPRERLAFLNFFVVGDPRVVPPALSTWTPEHLAPYFSAAYDLAENSEVYWMMGRLGLTVGDVVREGSARRWLARSLGVRYLVLGRIQQSGSFTVTTSLIDAEQGCEVGRGQVFVRTLSELKLRLPELTRLTLLTPTDRARLEQLAAEQEAEFLRAQEAYHRGQFGIALNLAIGLKKKHPFNVRIEFLIGESDRRAKLGVLEEARRREAERLRQLAEAAARRQAELALAAEFARQKTATRAEMEWKRQREVASERLTVQARAAVHNNQFSLAVQLFDGALAFRIGDDALLRESAVARSRAEADRRRMMLEQQTSFAEAARRHRDLELAAARRDWQTERQRHDTTLTSFFEGQRRQDQAEYTRSLDQAQRLKAQGRFDQAAALLQSAKRIKPGDEVERLLADALMEQARAQAKAQDAARLSELERKLAQEQVRRKQAEQDAQKNWQLYQAALREAQEAHQQRHYTVAVAKYQEAGRLFRTEAVVTGLQSAKAGLNTEALANAAKKREAEQKGRQSAEATRLLAQGRAAAQARKFDEALAALRRAQELDPDNVDVVTTLTRVEQSKSQALEDQQSRSQAGRVQLLLTQAKARVQAQQFEAALALLDAALKLTPNDPQIVAQTAAVKKAQGDAQAAVLAAKQHEETARKDAEARIQREETAKKQAAQARQQAEMALARGDLKAAESALAAGSKLAPNDPALRKLHQDLTKAQSVAARERAQSDARAKLEEDSRRRMSAAAQQQQGKITEILRQAQIASSKKDFSETERLINEAIALDPTNLAIGKAQRDLQAARKADADTRSAMNAEQKKKDDAALAKKKTEFAKLMREGKEALGEEDYDKAAKLFEAATKLNPEDADAPLLLGMARRDVERAKAEAEATRKAALEEEARRKKEEADAKNREKMEAAAKKKAEDDLNRRLAMDTEAKKRAEALKALTRQQYDAALKAGKQDLAAKRYDQAIKSFERALQLMPDDKEGLVQLQTARRLKNEAERSPEKTAPPAKNEPSKTPPPAKTRDPGKVPAPSAAQLLAQAGQLQRQQKWSEALQLYRQVLVITPNDKNAKAGVTQCEFQVNFEAGKAALAKKDADAAVKSLEAALKIVPNHAEAQKLLKQARDMK